MKKIEVFFFLLLSVLCFHGVRQQEWAEANRICTARGVVTKVPSGDVFWVQIGAEPEETKVDLYGIMAPLEFQVMGKKTQKVLYDILIGSPITVCFPEDSRQGVVFYYHLNLNTWLLENGYVWLYDCDSSRHECFEFEKAESAARSNRVGIWAEENPVPPWEILESARAVTRGR